VICVNNSLDALRPSIDLSRTVNEPAKLSLQAFLMSCLVAGWGLVYVGRIKWAIKPIGMDNEPVFRGLLGLEPEEMAAAAGEKGPPSHAKAKGRH
jgi:hypothetical protein